MPHFTHQNVTLTYQHFSPDRNDSDVQLIFAHGWGQSSAALEPLAQSFLSRYDCYLVDLPGFGMSPKPPDDWGTRDYADLICAFLHQLPRTKKRIWVGHSFGCRIGLHLGADEVPPVDGLMLLAAAGIPKPLSLMQKLKRLLRFGIYKVLRHLLFKKSWQLRLRQMFGSPDYLNSGALRCVFLNVIREDLTDIARQITLPTHIIYGEADTDTPPAMGRRFAELIDNSQLSILPDFDHFTLLTDGRHQVATRLQTMIEA